MNPGGLLADIKGIWRDRDMPAMFNAGLTDPRDTDAEVIIGLDGLLVITHPANPVQSM